METPNMTAIVMKDLEENGIGAAFNRDMVVGHLSKNLNEVETEMIDDLTPRIEKANASFEAGKLTAEQRDLIIACSTRQLERQSALNDRIMKPRR